MAYNNYKTAGNWNQYPQKRTYAPYNPNYGRSTYGGSGVKKSGANFKKMSKGKHVGLYAVSAWRKTKHGLMTAKAFPVDGVVHDKNGNDPCMRYVVTVVHQGFGTVQTYWCVMNLTKRVIHINELGLFISEKGSGRTGKGTNVRGTFARLSRR
ncbi:hypothetical protein KRE49_05235 [Elizabethkingia meningoseptica]|uniref:hypothetical protein n=1 Tax=Elizabethkingia meningoseptica TaxID=238 RepID=UPI0023B1CA70|nr:hypothetical protein [Elizabethkingia meningoseptica]MDE5515144.1 hypothetical protein [Elizabethkingia meningoseptica]MDN4032966.1 hypothetical protein [Elizabethkingia meningoseptica]